MYLKKIRLKNIKCFKDLELDFTEGEGVRLWTTLFGKNALGKSTLLQAMGAVVAGPSAIRELLPVAEGWARKGEPYGEVSAEILWSEGDAATQGRPRINAAYAMQYLVSGNDPSKLPDSLPEKPTVAELVSWSGNGGAKQGQLTKDRKFLQQTAYAEGQEGWLACGYGPFRRLKGGSERANTVVAAERRSARFVTLFMEDAAVTNATAWLTTLHNTAREGDKQSERDLDVVKRAISEKLFPEPTELVVDTKSALLRRHGKPPFAFEELSDGYRSMLALAIDLLRWLVMAFPHQSNPLESPGVVLIDELDTHLHPSWQRTIGHWLREKFPKIQFIIATHSPFLAQVADVESPDATPMVGQPILGGGNIRLEETDDGVRAIPSGEPARQMGPEQILMSELFDMASLLSPPVESQVHRFQELHRKRPQGLSELESKEYEQLNLLVENIPLGISPEEREKERHFKQAVRDNAEAIRHLE